MEFPPKPARLSRGEYLESLSITFDADTVVFGIAARLNPVKEMCIRDRGYVSPELESDAQREIFDETVRTLFAIYDELEAAGVPKEDARFVLPYLSLIHIFNHCPAFPRRSADAPARPQDPCR